MVWPIKWKLSQSLCTWSDSGKGLFNNTAEEKKGAEYWLWIVLLRMVTVENSLQYRTLIGQIGDIFVKLHLSIDNAWSSYAKEQK